MVDGGVGDVLIANEVVGAAKLNAWRRWRGRRSVSGLRRRRGQRARLDAAARAAGVTLDVLVEIDVGANAAASSRARRRWRWRSAIAACGNLRFAGLQAYQGAAQHLRTVAERRERDRGARSERVQPTRALLERAGIACDKVTGAGTGSLSVRGGERASTTNCSRARTSSWTPITRATTGPRAASPRFEHSLFVWTTVMSRPTPARAVVDAGLKASSVDSGMPRVADCRRRRIRQGLRRARRASQLNGGARARAGRQAEADPGPLRPDGQPLRLVRLRARRARRGAVADHGARRAALRTP